MPGPSNVWGKALIDAIEANKVSEELIDDKVKRILTVAEFSNRFQEPEIKDEEAIDRPEHRSLLRKAAADGMVLLKNEGLLPLKQDIKNSRLVFTPPK